MLVARARMASTGGEDDAEAHWFAGQRTFWGFGISLCRAIARTSAKIVCRRCRDPGAGPGLRRAGQGQAGSWVVLRPK